MSKLKFLDLFAGIGGFRIGMEMAGHECVGFCEIDRFARKSYKAIHDTEKEMEWHDITTITDNAFRTFRGQVDVICGGFPCQAFSVAGKRGGFSDTRGTLFFEIARAAKQIKPRFLFLENVKGLLSHDKGKTFETILYTLDELGYDAEWQVLNSKDFGVPQNRERVFIIGHLRGAGEREVFPIEGAGGEVSVPVEIIAHRKGYRRNTQVFDPNGITETLDTGQGGGRGHYTIIKHELKQKVRVRKFEIPYEELKKVLKDGKKQSKLTNKEIAEKLNQPVTKVEHWFRNDPSFSVPDEDVWFQLKEILNIKTDEFDKPVTEFIEKDNEFEKSNRVYDEKGIAPTLTRASSDEKILVRPVLTPDRVNKRQNGRRFKENGEPMFTITSQDRHGVYDGYRIRKLTPKECWRLQGFPDELFEKAAEVNSDSQLYKQAGNSVTVNVIYEIAKRLKGKECLND